jgi:4-amino-4-deoxychorismate lyase
MFWYAGKLNHSAAISLPVDHPTLLYGASIFTTLRIYENSLNHPLTHWLEHRQRLAISLENLAWEKPDWLSIETGINHLKQNYPILRIAIFPDGTEYVIGRYLKPDLSQRQRQGIRGWLAQGREYQRTYLGEHKTGNYLGAWLALQAAQKKGYDEAILVNTRGYWQETSTGNLWGWRGGAWFTPWLNTYILPGVIRGKLLSWLQEQGIEVEENLWTEKFVQSLEGIAYSNSVVEIIPFREIIGEGGQRCYDRQEKHLETLRKYWQI